MIYLPPISKRAVDVNQVLDVIFKSVWPKHKGFWEKIFSLLSYAVPFVPGLGWAVFLLEQAAHYLYGFGIADIGKALDKSGVTGTIYGLYEGLSQIVKKMADTDRDTIEKQAFIGGLFKLTGALPKLVRIIWAAVKWLMLVVGVSSAEELLGRGDELAAGLLQGNPIVELLRPDESAIALPDKKDESSTLDIEQLKNLMKDPSQFTKMFGGGLLTQ